ncbi:Eukaryotic translation initiation factor 4 gamma 3 [Araneus ventricosus]|uniref:Eukaryotic translation initiation factor 4 gamma 3 n=1 Tax=Araneus ventricosus TaxID=182803 RepID=A0A4Y2F517_ARAVE|nr:Eukaryotic translation initiation factor 4 gamma 3 [Araneus ventricosus]
MEPPRMTHLNGWDENWNGVWSATTPFAWSGHNKAWRKSGVQWMDIIGTDRNVAEFMDKHANVSVTSGPTFVRALVTAVHKSCLSVSEETWELNTSKLKSMIPLISHYVSTNEKLQLQAMYAVQALMNQLSQPSGLLHQMFDVLYDGDVISVETLLEWEKSDDPNEAEGKGVAVHSVKSVLLSRIRSIQRESIVIVKKFELEILTNLHVLDLPESEKHNFGIMSVCVSVNTITRKLLELRG